MTLTIAVHRWFIWWHATNTFGASLCVYLGHSPEVGAAANDYVVTATVETDFGRAEAQAGKFPTSANDFSPSAACSLFIFFESSGREIIFVHFVGHHRHPKNGSRLSISACCSRHPAESVAFGNNGPASQ